MNITIEGHGDPSVGIWPPYAAVTIEEPNENYADKDYRELVRTAINTAFQEIFDEGKLCVMFEDEWPKDSE